MVPQDSVPVQYSCAIVNRVHSAHEDCLCPNDQADPWFLGFGGDVPAFFYDQSANAENFESLAVP